MYGGRREDGEGDDGRRTGRGLPEGDLELEVGEVATGGACTARAPDGRVVFVRHALPGERVRARVTEARSRYLRADAVDVLTSAAERVVPPCPYAGPGRCGGCDWQHASLPEQRRLKAQTVRQQLRRIAGLDVELESGPEAADGVEELPGTPDGLGWRTRVQFAVDEAGAVGLRRHRSHQVQPVDRCAIAHPLVEDLGVERLRWPGVAAVEVAVGATSGDRLVDVRRTSAGSGAAGTGRPAPALPSLAAPTGVRVDGRWLRGRGSIREHAAGRSFRSAGGFWQVHPAAADALAAAVLRALDPRPGECALDLYCGAGLFAAALADVVGRAGSVLAVEGDRRAAADAEANLRELPQVTVRAAPVDGRLISRLPRDPDVVVLDPPRSGAGPDVVAAIAARHPRRIAYVACDPAALARDAAALAVAGYRLAHLRAFDLFPMTAHVECVAEFRPAGGAAE